MFWNSKDVSDERIPMTTFPLSSMVCGESVFTLTYCVLNNVVLLSPVATSADVLAIAVVSEMPEEYARLRLVSVICVVHVL